MKELKEKIREVPDFPKPGILFYDLTTLLKDSSSLKRVIDLLTQKYSDQKIDQVVAIESRGFIFGPALACNLQAGFVPVRKEGRLPSDTISASYDLEYGQGVLEIHTDAIQKGERVLVVDDLIATGGTADATARMVHQLGGEVVGFAFIVELEFLKGKEKLDGFEVFSILQY
jgi:adenine phosphoribosyltransferase